MLIVSRVAKHNITTCVVQLEENELYNEDALLDVCSEISLTRYASVVGNIPGYNKRYEVSVQTGSHPYGDVFAQMVKQDEGFYEYI